MKKYLLLYFIVFAFLLGCAAFKPPVKKVEGNTFYCSSPKLEVEVSQELKFVGEKRTRMDGEGRDYQRPVRAFYKSFIFEGMSNQLTISIVKLPRDWQFMTPSFGGGGNNLYFGKLRLGSHNYQYATFKEGPYIQRIYSRNAHTDTVQIRIIYMEKRDTELASEGEQLILFDKNCKAAFTIKSEKVASLSKPDSSISADYQKIIGHWWMEGEVMVIEEIDNRLSIRMDRLRGYHLGPSGQAKYRETTHSHNISWDGKHLEFEIWMPSGAGAYEVSYSLTLSGPNTLFGTKQASGSSLKIEVEFEKE
jgi:hypothetical protein